MTIAVVIAVSACATHAFSKVALPSIRLLKGLGVEGDAHMGPNVKHRSRVAIDPSQPNLRQVHLIPSELFQTLAAQGFTVQPGDMGENITTRGIDLLSLPRGTRLRLGNDAIVEITGLRNPCKQIDGLQQGLMEAVIERDPERGLIRKAGIMGIVLEGGTVTPGDDISIERPPMPHEALKPV
jgi:MOSC domain-containing protein YiiM